MDINEAIRHAIDGNAILFTGSGFSFGSKNLTNDSPMTGRAFAQYLYKESNIVTTDENLALASQLYVKNFGAAKLADLCRTTFSIRSSADHHQSVFQLPWQRIYTTNYDDLLEKSSTDIGKSLVPVTIEDSPEKYLSSARVCLHINGFISRLAVTDLAGGFKLTAGSYFYDGLTTSSWSTVLRQDFRMARAVIFIGYSMYDLDIQRILHAEDISDKTFFITSPDPSDTDKIMLPMFGTVLPIGIGKFADFVDAERRSYTAPRAVNEFMAFERVKLPAIKKSPTNGDMEKLFLYGNLDSGLIDSSVSGESSRGYLVDRLSSFNIDQVLSGGDDVVLTADLGNGKTITLDQVALELTGKGWNVYRFTTDNKASRKEVIRLLDMPGNTILLIDNYIPFLEFIDFVSVRRTGKNFRFLLTARSHVNEAYRDRLENALRTQKVAEFDLNRLSRDEITSMISLIDSYGLWAEFSASSDLDKLNLVRTRCDSQIHQVLLKLYSSPQISSKISDLFAQIPSSLRRIAIAVFILKGSGLSSDRSTLNELLAGSPLIRISNTDRESVKFLWDENSGHLKLKSSVMAEYYLTNLSDASEVVDVLLEMYLKAHELRDISNEYEYFIRSIMSFSALQKLLPSAGLRSATIKFYEAIQNTDFTKRNPHYWLQYAIARLSFEDNLDEIAPYFQSAYVLAKNSNYNTYQIDNHYARFLLVKAGREKAYEVAYAFYLEAKALLLKQMLSEQKHYPYRVAASILDFVRSHLASMHPSHRKEMESFTREIARRISKLPQPIQRHKHVTTCIESLKTINLELNTPHNN